VDNPYMFAPFLPRSRPEASEKGFADRFSAEFNLFLLGR